LYGIGGQSAYSRLLKKAQPLAAGGYSAEAANRGKSVTKWGGDVTTPRDFVTERRNSMTKSRWNGTTLLYAVTKYRDIVVR
jgi:hypothetical protein